MQLYQDRMTISKCLKKFIILGQIFGYFPIQNITRSKQTFNFKSFRMLYAVYSIIGPVFLCAMQVIKATKVKVGIDQVYYMSKYIGSAYVGMVFIELARTWPEIMDKWRQVEEEMKGYGSPKTLNRRVFQCTAFFMMLFFVEYVLHQVSRMTRSYECHHDSEKAIKFYLGNLSLSHVFNHIPFNIPTSLMIQYWIYQVEFAYTYTDIFIMVISICLSSRLEQVTRRIRQSCQKKISDKNVWKKLRKNYTSLENLTIYVNKRISNIILLSFLSNCLSILIEVYKTLKPKQNLVEEIYYYFSLIFLLSRTMSVCLYGSMIYEESRKPLISLHSVSHDIYNKEIEIFVNQLMSHEICINGKYFFKIKRNVVLQIVGAIVTYEIVLVQFNQDSLQEWAKSTRCS